MEEIMISFEIFNFDIIILIIIFFSIIFGAYYGIKREIRHFLVVFIPLLVLHFSFSDIIVILRERTEIFSYMQKIVHVLANNGSYNTDLIVATIISCLCYLILMLIAIFIMKAFESKNEKYLLKKETKKTRLFGGLLGIFQGYFISLIVLCFASNIFIINYDSFLTSFISSTSKNISYYCEYDYFKDVCKKYNDLSYEMSIIFGEKEKDIYEYASLDEKFFEDSFAKETKDDTLKKYYTYLEQKKSLSHEEFKSHEELKKYFKYKDTLIKSLKLKNCDLDEYCSAISELLSNNPNDVLDVLRTVLENEDYYNILPLIKNTKNKKILGDDFVYEIILVNYPNIKRINSMKKNNLFLEYYINGIDKTDEGKLIEKIQ